MSNPFLQKSSNRFSALNEPFEEKNTQQHLKDKSSLSYNRFNKKSTNTIETIEVKNEKPLQSEINLTENFDTLFPETIVVNKTGSIPILNNNFVKALNTEIIKTNEPNEPTPAEIKEYDITTDPNYIMTKAINIMQYYWDLDKRFYDHMHGEGAYDELYCMDPIYSDSDDDSDEEYYEEEDDTDEYY